MSLQSVRIFSIFHGTDQWSLVALITRRLSPSIMMLLMPNWIASLRPCWNIVASTIRTEVWPRLKDLGWARWPSWLRMKTPAAATDPRTEPSKLIWIKKEEEVPRLQELLREGGGASLRGNPIAWQASKCKRCFHLSWANQARWMICRGHHFSLLKMIESLSFHMLQKRKMHLGIKFLVLKSCKILERRGRALVEHTKNLPPQGTIDLGSECN